MPTRRALVLGVIVACAGCATAPPPPQGWRERLREAPPPPAENAFPMPPAALEELMRHGFEIRDAKPTDAGITGALRIEAYYPQVRRTLTFKWKAAPEDGESWNNVPRYEVAAYAIQKWFLDPPDYVVPTTFAVCIPHYALPGEHRGEVFAGSRCVLGAQSVWLERVTKIDDLLDRERFYRDPNYARHLANYNLLTYLIENRDTRAGNFLVLRDPSNPRVYSVDNGIAFGARMYNFFVAHWDEIRVPALPRESIERLRRVTSDDLAALRVVAALRADPDGILRPIPRPPAFEPGPGVRMRDGTLTLGLEPDEIDGVRGRLRALLEAVDEGETPVF